MMEVQEIKTILKGGRHPDKYSLYRKAYTEITGKTYSDKCTGCATKFLYRFLQHYVKNN